MNEDQMKTKMFLLQMLDWVLFLSALSFGVYALFYAQNKLLMSLIALLGLLLVDYLGKFTFDQTAILRVDLNILRRMRNRPWT
ncbi:MAG: hypothetical protein P8126_11915 [Gammaproteobacteria bacterium]|jgi:hypothetical protein